MQMEDICVAAAILKDDLGRVLLAKRASGKSYAGYWEFPGGKIESGESAEVCLRRELFEELGINVTIGEPLVCSITWTECHVLKLQAFSVAYTNEKLTLHDHDEAVWVDLPVLHTFLVPPADVPIILFLQRQGTNCQLRF